jgi:PAS domain S-box-containing protein
MARLSHYPVFKIGLMKMTTAAASPVKWCERLQESSMSWDARKASIQSAELLAVAAAYFVAGRVGLAIPFTNGVISPLWPAAGIALGAILLLGRRVWPGVLAGAFLVNFSNHAPWGAALATGVGSTVGPMVAAVLLQRTSAVPIRRLSNVLSLICFSAAGMAIGAVIGPVALLVGGLKIGNGLLPGIFIWWIGDLLGCLLVAPLIFSVGDWKLKKGQVLELSILVAGLLIASQFLFRQSTVIGSVFGFALLPFIVWGAVRFSVAGATLSSCLASVIAVWETSRGYGPFAVYGSWAHHVEALQIFMAVLSLSGLCLAAVIAERDTVEEALEQEEKLRRAQDQYRRIIETTNDGVWVLDAGFLTTFVNHRTAEMLGYTQEEMLGRPLFDFLFEDDLPEKRADLERRRRGAREVFYNRCRRKDGSEIWALVSTNPVFGDNGEFTGVLAMLSDVTLLRKTEEALRRNEKLITAGRLAASISHEVNNPLEAIVNLLYLLKNQPLDEQSRKYVALAEKQILRVSAISKRALGFFRDTSAWVELPLQHLLDDTLSFYEHELGTRAIKVVREYGTREMVRVSQGEIQQVFANLISNALDAMGKGGVLTLRVSEATHRNCPGILVEVEDTGVGISDEGLKHLFEPFFTTKQDTGTGLGLWVAREIIEKHGGTITVSSRTQPFGKSGTRFSILLLRSSPTHAVA